jgi:hypothetical protein
MRAFFRDRRVFDRHVDAVDREIVEFVRHE